MKNLFIRAVTALFFSIIMVGGLLWNVYSYAGLMMLIGLGCAMEYFGMMRNVRAANRVSAWYLPVMVFILWVDFALSWLVARGDIGNVFLLVIPVSLLLPFILELFADSSKPFNNISINVAGLFYLVLPLVSLNFVAINTAKVYQPLVPLSIILLMWANDVFAYLVGTFAGKHKFFVRISPSKTWEGIMGGVFGTMVMAIVLDYYFELFEMQHWLIIASIVCVFSTLGDLIESMLKRSLKMKDSGNLLPGHGGMLDRFDAFLFATPFVALYILLFVN